MSTPKKRSISASLLTTPSWIKKYPVVIIPLIVVAFYLVFPKKLVDLVIKLLTIPIFQSVSESNLFLDSLLILASLYAILRYIAAAVIGKRLSFVERFCVFSYTFIYIGIKLFSNNAFVYTRFSLPTLSDLALLDATLIPAIGIAFYYVILSWIKLQKKPTDKTNEMYSDTPIILTEKNDLFKRLQLVDQLISIIKRAPTDDQSFSIGLSGKWGSGKTTLLKTLSDRLNSDDCIIQLEFNPWLNTSTESLTRNFFKALASKLSFYDANLKSQLLKYGKQLLATVDSPYLSVVKSLSSIVFETDVDLMAQHGQISDSLRRLGKKVVVFIDDIDRLTKEEIKEVLRTIRNTANFPNTVFITAYDKSYLLKTADIPAHYLEKIFQLEQAMPLFPITTNYRDYLFEELKKFASEEHQQIIDSIKDPASKGTFFVAEIVPPISTYVSSFRDVNRFMNLFIISYDRIKNDIYFPDFLATIILRLKYPGVYALLYYSKYSFLQPSEETQFFEPSSGMLHLKSIKGGISRFQDSVLYGYLAGRQSEYGLSTDDLNAVTALLYVIFGMQAAQAGLHSERRTMEKNYLSIAYLSNFDRYFDYLMEGRLDEISFRELLKQPLPEIKEKIDEWNKDNAIADDLQMKLSHYNTFDTFDTFQKIILAIVYYANLPIVKNPGFKNSFNFGNFINKFQAQLQSTSQDLLARFFATLFSPERINNEWSYIHDLCDNIVENRLKDVPLPNIDLALLVASSLDDTVTIITNYSPETVKFIRKTQKLLSHFNSNTEATLKLDATRSKFKEIIKCNLKNFLESVINVQHPIGIFDVDISAINAIFSDIPSFEDFLRSVDQDDPWLAEFQDFLTAFLTPKNANPLTPIEFSFTHLKP